MARKPSTPEVGSPSIAPEHGLELLRRQADAGKQLLDDPQLSDLQVTSWRTIAEDCVVRAFGKNTDRYYTFVSAAPAMQAVYYGFDQPSPQEELRQRREFLQHKVNALNSLLVGRPNVCPLYVSGVEIPSDYLGVVFTPLDEGGAWKLTLARELKAAGLEVALNRAV